jgi:small GTP-binding protein
LPLQQQQEKMENYTNEIKINFLLVGDEGVGKTSLQIHFTRLDQWSEKEIQKEIRQSSPTIGVDLARCSLLDQEMGMLRFNLCDLAGAEKFYSGHLLQSYFRNKEAVIFMFDLTRANTLETIKNCWYDRVVSARNPLWRGMLVGNKSDLPQRQISPDYAKDVAHQLGMDYMELSALEDSGEKIRYPFLKLARLLYDAGIAQKQQQQQFTKQGPVESSCC